MDTSLRILQVVHGYPPREVAGVEQHTRALVHHLVRRGHHVHVLAATRAPGMPQYAQIQDHDQQVPITRIVNNIPARPLGQAESDPAIDHTVHQLTTQFQPDIVHIQHLQFLSTGMRFAMPTVITLHDGWGFCPAGGVEMLPEHRPCPGPAADRCPSCYASWRPVPTATARSLMNVAGRLSAVVSPDRLHQLWQTLPETIRRPIAREGHSPPSSVADFLTRQRTMQQFYQSASLRLSPSQYLAERARRFGLGPVTIHRNGSTLDAMPRTGGGPFVFVGTLAPHKGPSLVLDAWRRAFPDGNPGLLFYGPRQGSTIPREQWGGVLDRHGVAQTLSRARGLIMGSKWPENAPLVVLEARAAGCPVVAPRIGGIPELIEEGRDGLLYAPGNIDALSECLQQLVTSPPSPARPPPTAAQQADVLIEHYRSLL